MFFYMLICRPIKESTDNWLNIYNEVLIMLTFIALFIINTSDFGYLNISYFGWVLIVLTMISFAATWALMLPGIVKSIWQTVSGLFRKSPDKLQNDKDSPTEQPAMDEGDGMMKVKRTVRRRRQNVSPSIKKRRNSRISDAAVRGRPASGAKETEMVTMTATRAKPKAATKPKDNVKAKEKTKPKAKAPEEEKKKEEKKKEEKKKEEKKEEEKKKEESEEARTKPRSRSKVTRHVKGIIPRRNRVCALPDSVA